MQALLHLSIWERSIEKVTAYRQIHIDLHFFSSKTSKQHRSRTIYQVQQDNERSWKHKAVTCWAVTEWKSLAMWFLLFVLHQITVPGTLPATAASTLHLYVPYFVP